MRGFRLKQMGEPSGSAEVMNIQDPQRSGAADQTFQRDLTKLKRDSQVADHPLLSSEVVAK